MREALVVEKTSAVLAKIVHLVRLWGLIQLKHGLKNLGNGYHGYKKKPKMLFSPEKPLELQIYNLLYIYIYIYIYIYSFTLGIICAGSHLVIHLSFSVGLEMP